MSLEAEVPFSALQPPEREVTIVADASEPVGTSIFARSRTIELPFDFDPAQPGVITRVDDDVAPAWLTEGSRILSADGTQIASLDEIRALGMAKSKTTGEDIVDLKLAIETDDGTLERVLTVSVEHELTLPNGLGFQVEMTDQGWVTVVSNLPQGSTSLEIGDQLVAHMMSNTLIEGPDSLSSLIDFEMAEGRSDFTFAIKRNGKMWVETLSIPTAAL